MRSASGPSVKDWRLVLGTYYIMKYGTVPCAYSINPPGTGMRLKSWSSGSLIIDFQIEILKHVIIFKIDVAENVEDGQRLTGKD